MNSVSCPACQEKHAFGDEAPGNPVQCPGCKQTFTMPASGESAVPGTALTRSAGNDHPSTQGFERQDAGQVPPVTSLLVPPQLAGELGRLGGYRVLNVLGRGGMGVVFLAEDPALKRLVALKALLPGLAGSDRAGKRFLREAQAMAAVTHDHVARIYQVGTDRGVPFLAMEFLQGETLEARLRREEKLPAAEVLRIGREIAEGLEAAHAIRLIHRDVKPANVWLEGPRGRVKILDFGLARSGSQPEAGLTQEGVIVGTPGYISPEQANGEPAEVRSDLFSLGVVLYRMSTGQQPFQGKDVLSTLRKLDETPASPAELDPQVSGELSALVMRLLERDPARRPASAAEVAGSLRALEAGGTARRPSGRQPSPPRSGRWWVFLAGGLAAVVVLAAVFTLRTPRGTLVVTVSEPDVQVLVDGAEKVTIDSRKVGRVELTPGEHQLIVRRGQEELHTESFVVKSGGEVVIDARWEPRKAATPPDPPGPAAAPPSPFDRLERSAIPARQLALAGEGDPERAPAGLVGLLGEGRLNHWQNAVYVGFRDGGKTLVTAGRDGLLRWWDVPALSLRRSVVVPGMARNVSTDGFDLSPDGKLAAAQAGNGKLLLLRTDTLAVVREFPSAFPAFSPDGKVLAVVGPSLQVLDLDTLALRELGDREERPPTWMALPCFSPDGTTLAISVRRGEQEAGVWFYDVPSGKRIRTVPGSFYGQRVVFHPSGLFLLAPQAQGETTLWDEQGKKVADVKGLWADGLALTPDGKRLVVTQHGELRSYDWGKWDAPVGRYEDGGLFQVHSLAVSPAGDLVAGGGLRGGVCLVRLSDARALAPSLREWCSGRPPVATADGQQLVQATANGSLRWYQVSGPEMAEVDRLETGCGYGWRIGLEPGGRWASAGVAAGKLRVWDLTGRHLHAEVAVPGTDPWQPQALAPAGDRAALVRRDRSTVFVEVPSGKVLREFPAVPAGEGELALAVSPDGRRVALASATPGRVTVYDAQTGKKARELTVPQRLHYGELHRFPLFTPDGSRLLCMTYRYAEIPRFETGQLDCWDTATWQQLFTLEEHPATPWLGFRPDSRQAAWAGCDGTVRLLDLDTGLTEQTLRVGPPGGDVDGVDYAPDGRHLVTTNANGTAYVLRIPPSPYEVTTVTGPDWLDLLRLPAAACEARPADLWVQRDGTWTTAGVPPEHALLALPMVPRGGYDLTAEASRREGDDALSFHLPVGPRSVSLSFASGRGTTAGLSRVGGAAHWEGAGNATTVRQEPFPVGKKVGIRVAVRVDGDRAEVKATADGVPPIHWSGPLADLSPQEDLVPQAGRLGVGMFQTRYVLHEFKFRRVDGLARVYRPRALPAGAPTRRGEQ